MDPQERKMEIFKLAVKITPSEAACKKMGDNWEKMISQNYNSLCSIYDNLQKKEKEEAAKNAPPRCIIAKD